MHNTIELDDGHLNVLKGLSDLFILGLPTAISFTATTLSNTISFFFIGSYGDKDTQAGHGLGYSIGNMLVLTVALGLVNGMDTLCPLAIGAGHREGCWAHLFQALCVVALTVPFLMPLTLFSSPILIFLRQDPSIARLAEQYLVAGLPGLLFICVFEALRKFLIYHHDYPVQTCASILTIPLQILFLELFVVKLGLGAVGAGYARSFTTFITMILLLMYIILYRDAYGWKAYCYPKPVVVEMQSMITDELPKRISLYTAAAATAESQDIVVSSTLRQDSSMTAAAAALGESSVKEKRSPCEWCINDNCEADSTRSLSSMHRLLDPSLIIKPNQHWWQGLTHFFRIAIPSTFLCVFEWVAFEVQIFIAAYLGSVELSAVAASAALSSLFFILSLSVAVTLNGEIGRAMGAKKPRDARTLATAGCLASACLSLPIVILTLSFREYIARLYSATPEIRRAIVRNLFFQSGVIVVDSLHAILGGVVKALNLQRIGCVFDAIGLLGVMQAVGIFFAFKTSLLGSGFLIGTVVGVSFVLLGYVTLLFKCVDWERKSQSLIGAKKQAIEP